jgi:hypothetical protein
MAVGRGAGRRRLGLAELQLMWDAGSFLDPLAALPQPKPLDDAVSSAARFTRNAQHVGATGDDVEISAGPARAPGG